MFSRFITHPASLFLSLVVSTISFPGRTESLMDTTEHQ